MNIFFAHTPFQILAAQNIIIEENHLKNILVLGGIGKNTLSFYKNAELIIIPRLWSKKYHIGDINLGVFHFNKFFKSYYELYQFSNRIKEIVKENKSTDFYFGDINHLAYAFITCKYNSIVRVHYYEEGLSHYCNLISKANYKESLLLKIKSVIVDRLIYGPYRVKKFSRFLFSTIKFDLGNELGITRKISLIPARQESYNQVINFKVYFSDSIKKIIESEKEKLLQYFGYKTILYLSSTLVSEFANPVEDEKYVLEQYFKNLDMSEYVVLVKLHPKDSESKKIILEQFLSESNIRYFILFNDYHLPIELLFTKIKFDKIIGFDSSALFYAHFLIPGAKMASLIPVLLEKYNKANVSNRMVEEVWVDIESTLLLLFNKRVFS